MPLDPRTVINLTRDELVRAACVGAQRNAEDIADGKKEGYFSAHNDYGWADHVYGAVGELVFAKFLGVEWKPAGMKKRDVEGHQIRCSLNPNSPLRVRRRDNDEDPAVLIVNEDPERWLKWRVVGGLKIAEAKRIGKLSDPGNRGLPCWEVPQSALKQFEWE